MKNKKLLYLLLPLTIGLWGVIIFKIVNSASGIEGVENQDKIVFQKSDGLTMPDTFSIICNYPDPFLGKTTPKQYRSPANSVTSAAKAKDVVKEKKKAAITTLVWPEVVYKGIIKNQKSNKQLALLQINGKSNAMKMGESYENIELIRIFKDSIEVKFGKEKKYVKK